MFSFVLIVFVWTGFSDCRCTKVGSRRGICDQICFFQDEPSSDPAEQKADQPEEVESPTPEDKQEEMVVSESPTAQVFAKALKEHLHPLTDVSLFMLSITYSVEGVVYFSLNGTL